MIYSLARIGAVVAMKVEDHYPAGKRWGCGCTRKAASAMRCPRITSWSAGALHRQVS
jgi:hypothetical protein